MSPDREPEASDVMELTGDRIAPGERRDLALPITQSYSGTDVSLPLRVIRGPAPGPTLLLTAAVHGDELNGTGIIRELILDTTLELRAGTLILVPVVNILGYERNARYLPDRRDLNRSFPGSPEGSLASRIADRFFRELVLRCDYLLDFHTAAARRTNFPNVRGDLSRPEVRRLARAFGSSLVVDSKGIPGSLRSCAVDAGIPAIILEAGEVWKTEPSVIEEGLRGARNVMIELGLIEGSVRRPPYQVRIDQTRWLRSDAGGLLRFHAAPGDVVEAEQPVATITTLLGAELGIVRAPKDGIVMGLTTLPSVKPGDPVCNLAMPRKGIAPIRAALRELSGQDLHERLRDDLASSFSVEDPDEWN